jgi:hypothetical protein
MCEVEGSPTVQNQLAESVPVNEEPYPLSLLDSLQFYRKGHRFRGIKRLRALVGAMARRGGAANLLVPVGVPVTVEITTDAGSAVLPLPVLAPHAVALFGLGVNEACGVLVGEDLQGWGWGVDVPSGLTKGKM